jgi:hypothetical protein
MRRPRREEETQLLEQIARYREEYREKRKAAVIEERERRHAQGEVYVAGLWLSRSQCERVARPLGRRQFWIRVEVLAGILLSGAAALGVWMLFRIVFLP